MSILDKISDFANRAADKLIPKELAPFLPIAGAFAPGLGGVFASNVGRFLIPQLLTALSSAKQTGEIDPTQQAITGILSALQTPTQQTAAEKALLEQNPELLQRAERARTLEDAVRLTDDEFAKIIQDPNINIQGYQLEGADRLLGRTSPLALDVDSSNILKFTDPTTGQDLFFNELSPAFKDFSGTPSLNEFLEQTITRPIDVSGLTGQDLIDELAKAEGFTADQIANKLADIQKVQGGGQGLQALNRARQFFDSPIGFNLPTATKLGVGAAPFLAAQAANLEAEQEALEAEEAAEAERFAGARDDLFDYFRRLSDPRGIFAAMGGRVGAQEGGPISGITDMINQSIDEMQDNLSQQIQGGFTTQETIVPIDAAPTNATTQPQGFQALPNIDLFRQRINQMRSRLQQSGGQLGQSLFNPMSRQMMARQRQNQGQAGLSSLMNFAEGGMTSAPGVPSGMQVDGRNGTFIPMGVREKADDVPAMLSKNEFVMTADAVRAMGDGNVNKGAQRMYDLMNTLEARA
tara:strand:- start:233 stop:1798 length:1566 start_codon:yes stop_codon:yes gene_type:complete